MKSRVLVCGGRGYSDYERFREVMDSCLPFFHPDFCIIHGGCNCQKQPEDRIGADAFADQWGKDHGAPVIRMDANWRYYQRSAGGIRNAWMIQYAWPDLVIAFPGGDGTRNMINKARAARIDVYEVRDAV